MENQREDTTVEDQSAAEQPPAAEPEPAAKVNVQTPLDAGTNEHLKALANLWGETKTEAARKMLTGAIQHQYTVNKNLGRL